MYWQLPVERNIGDCRAGMLASLVATICKSLLSLLDSSLNNGTLNAAGFNDGGRALIRMARRRYRMALQVCKSRRGLQKPSCTSC